MLIKDSVLCRFSFFENVAGTGGVAQLVVPDNLKNEILQGVHEDVGGGHFGVHGENSSKVKREVLFAGTL